jgi:hypothetical protein
MTKKKVNTGVYHVMAEGSKELTACGWVLDGKILVKAKLGDQKANKYCRKCLEALGAVLAKTAPKVKVPKVKKERGIGALAKDLLRDGMSSVEIIAAVKVKFPESKINAAAVAWYKARL